MDLTWWGNCAVTRVRMWGDSLGLHMGVADAGGSAGSGPPATHTWAAAWTGPASHS